MIQRGYSARPSWPSAILGLLVFAFIAYILYRVAAFSFQVLIFGGPILLIVAYFMDKKVVQDYFGWIRDSFKANPLQGLLLSIVSLAAYPLVCGYLFAKVLIKRKLKKAMTGFQEKMQEQHRQAHGNTALGNEEVGYTEVKRDDGLIIRIPEKED